ncbi:hypothetical protein KGA66_02400, partial [Actinocrinis puniceicyclus]
RVIAMSVAQVSPTQAQGAIQGTIAARSARLAEAGLALGASSKMIKRGMIFRELGRVAEIRLSAQLKPTRKRPTPQRIRAGNPLRVPALTCSRVSVSVSVAGQDY